MENNVTFFAGNYHCVYAALNRNQCGAHKKVKVKSVGPTRAALIDFQCGLSAAYPACRSLNFRLLVVTIEMLN